MRTQDSKLVASKQDYEVNYISYEYNIAKIDVERACKEVGTSRRKIYKRLREWGYTIVETRKK